MIGWFLAGGAIAGTPNWATIEPRVREQPDFEGSFSEPPVLHWRRRLPGPPINAATHAEWGDPVVVAGSILVGSAAGKALYELDRGNGHVRRRYPARNSVEAPAALVDDIIYFSDTGGDTYAYTRDGEKLWSHDGNAPVLVVPTVTKDAVVVTNVDDLAVALDRQTGALLWRYRAKRDLTREAELALYAAPRAVVVDGEVLLGFSNGSLVGVDLETGEEMWKREVGEGRYPDLVAEPVPFGTDIFTSGYFKPLVAIDQQTHNVRWRVDVGGAYGVVVDERGPNPVLYHPGTDGTVRAVATLTGAVIWAWDSGTSGAVTSPVITDAGLVVASSDGSIYLLDPSDGSERWRWREPYLLRGISSVPSVDGRQLVFVSNAGFVVSMVTPAPQPDFEPAWP